MPSVVFRPRAKRDLESAVIYIGEVLDSPEAARKLARSVFDTLELVCSTPRMGMVFEDASLENRVYRWILVDKYRLFYTFENETVTVWRILHCQQDIDDFALMDIPGNLDPHFIR